MKHFLVLDVGTTGVKGFVFDSNLKPIAKSYYRLHKNFPKKGWVEQNPKELIAKSILALRKAVKISGVSTKSLASFGITNQRETTILWDKKTGQPVYPAIVWEDTRTSAKTKSLGRRYNALVSRKTGLPINPYFSATK
ncbi:MAG: FGGY family carbohydrate kinase, partial [Candidatus Colwellbacteria bacterium]|nr:FGGY family carbohydrate kinase [Candidatus Colwellbacteria bacterium]